MPGRPGKIIGDPELRAFVDANLPTMTLAALAAACRAKFGPARAPGYTSVWRYWSWWVKPTLPPLGQDRR